MAGGPIYSYPVYKNHSQTEKNSTNYVQMWIHLFEDGQRANILQHSIQKTLKNHTRNLPVDCLLIPEYRFRGFGSRTNPNEIGRFLWTLSYDVPFQVLHS